MKEERLSNYFSFSSPLILSLREETARSSRTSYGYGNGKYGGPGNDDPELTESTPAETKIVLQSFFLHVSSSDCESCPITNGPRQRWRGGG